MKTVAVVMIRVYQWTIAPLLGNNCRFTPSCSHYAIEALQKKGFFKGSWMTLKRLVRCNPWYDGGEGKSYGHDPIE